MKVDIPLERLVLGLKPKIFFVLVMSAAVLTTSPNCNFLYTILGFFNSFAIRLT